MPRLLSWILVGAVAIAALTAVLLAPADPAGMARVVFPLFLLALIAAGLRALLRSPQA